MAVTSPMGGCLCEAAGWRFFFTRGGQARRLAVGWPGAERGAERDDGGKVRIGGWGVVSCRLWMA